MGMEEQAGEKDRHEEGAVSDSKLEKNDTALKDENNIDRRTNIQTNNDNNNNKGQKKKGKRGNRKSARHGSRNQHRHKSLVKWILATFPHITQQDRQEEEEENDEKIKSIDNNNKKSDDGDGCEDVNCKSNNPNAALASSIQNNNNPNPSSKPKKQKQQQHILDVAGGKGELSARMTICHNIHVIMVDPRPANVSQTFLNSVLPRLPRKWREKIKYRLEHEDEFLIDRLIEERFCQLTTYFDLDAINNKKPNSQEGGGNDASKLHDAIRNCSLIVGIHADGATEAIVDAALQYQKPFVVVPCCVFPSLFKSRMVLDDDGISRHVRTHDQFCRYLVQKDSRFRMEVLPIEGRNVAIWWDGKDEECSEESNNKQNGVSSNNIGTMKEDDA